MSQFPFASSFPPTLEEALALGVPVPSKPSEVRLSCPVCGKPDGKLYVDTLNRVYFCFRCGRGGSLRGKEPHVRISRTPIQPLLPSSKVRFTLYYLDALPEVIQYLHSRGLADDVLTRYHVCAAKVTRLELPAVAIPVITPLRGVTDHYYFRTVMGEPSRHFFTFSKSHFVFGLPEAAAARRVYIVEGVFDVLRVSPALSAVCIFGKLLSSDQLTMLGKFAAREFVVALDGSAPRTDKLRVAAQIASVLHKKVGIAEIPEGKDPGDLGISLRLCPIIWLNT